MDFPKGLMYISNLLTIKDQTDLINYCFEQPWDDTLKRKTQQYGYRYNYGGGPLTRCDDIPENMIDILLRNATQLKISTPPDQVIVNHYEPGQGIGAHTDDTRQFGDTVVIFSLMSGISMHFSKEGTDPIEIYLRPGSALIMRDEARYQWKHEIKARKHDNDIPRSVRISITYRWVVRNERRYLK